MVSCWLKEQKIDGLMMTHVGFSQFNCKFRSFRSGTCLLFCLILLIVIGIGGCGGIRLENADEEPRQIIVNVERSGETQKGAVPYGSTVRQALQTLQTIYNPDDVISPPLATVLTNDMIIRIKAVVREEETNEQIVPFISQTVRNESLPEGETYIIQSGQNGLERITTQSIFEDGLLVSQVQSAREVIREAVPEILMYGVKAEHAPIQISGKMIYLSMGMPG